MEFREFVRTVLRRTGAPEETAEGQHFAVAFDSDGVNFVLDRAEFARVDEGRGGTAATTQFVLLRMLEEQGLAQPIPGGFHVAAEHASRIDDGTAALLDLPHRYDSSFRGIVSSHTASGGFGVRVVAMESGEPEQVIRRGALLTIADESYLATAPQLAALAAAEAHAALGSTQRTETTNVKLVADLQAAVAEGMSLDLAHFTNGGWTTTEAARVGVTGTTTAEGDLILSPSLGSDVPAQMLESRWGQLADAHGGGVLRVGTNLVLLDKGAVAAAHEVLRNRRISREDVATFLKTPSVFLDAALIDLELGFSVRVEGIGRLTHIDFGEATPSNLDWFAATEPLHPEILRNILKTVDDLERFEREYSAAVEQSAESLHYEGEIIDIREPGAVATAIEEVRTLVAEDGEQPKPAPPIPAAPREETDKVGFLLKETEEVVDRLHSLAASAVPGPIDTASLARRPFPHQREGIEWMLGLMQCARHEAPEQLYRLQGALLADDMGLGKTFMALVAIQQLSAQIEQTDGRARVKPTLVVAPLSLIENWEDELEKAFVRSPFTDVVVLQSGRDLPAFRVTGAGREGSQLSSALDEKGMVIEGHLRIALRVGSDAGAKRLDQPGRLVLTTYETLRDYQFSMSQIDWGVVVFDEAQAIKNPDSIRTRAAKALKAEFKLLATGTPVENSLGEFWCLIDTAQPGLLGDWRAFRDRFLLAATADDEDAREVRVRLGRELRDAVGPFMLRRIKEDHLDGLPSKLTHTGLAVDDEPLQIRDDRLAPLMPAVQEQRYDDHLRRFRSSRRDGAKGVAALSMLQSLRLASLHPDLDVHGARPAMPASSEQAQAQIAQSAKLEATMNVLRDVRARGEKAIIFAISKDLQLLLSLWIHHEFGIRPDVVNGDTSAVSTTAGDSRRQIIQRFEAADGFNVIVMSPIAAGVGLTIVGANHVIHLERHWNPAKEAQATDRVYRIGQTRDVHVYHPVARHPRIDSFDVLIDRLLRTKVSVKDAVMAPAVVSDAEIASAIG